MVTLIRALQRTNGPSVKLTQAHSRAEERDQVGCVDVAKLVVEVLVPLTPRFTKRLTKDTQVFQLFS